MVNRTEQKQNRRIGLQSTVKLSIKNFNKYTPTRIGAHFEQIVLLTIFIYTHIHVGLRPYLILYTMTELTLFLKSVKAGFVLF